MNIKEKLFTWVAVNFYFPYAKVVHHQDQTWLSMQLLEACEKGTLGKELHDFFLSRNLKLIPGSEDHDIKHVVYSYSITFCEEMCMQYFQFGNGNRSIPVLLLIVFGILVTPFRLKTYLTAYRRGKSANPLPYTGLTRFIHQPLQHLRQSWNILPRI